MNVGTTVQDILFVAHPISEYFVLPRLVTGRPLPFGFLLTGAFLGLYDFFKGIGTSVPLMNDAGVFAHFIVGAYFISLLMSGKVVKRYRNAVLVWVAFHALGGFVIALSPLPVLYAATVVPFMDAYYFVYACWYRGSF